MSAITFRIEANPPVGTAQQKGAAIIGGKARIFKKKKQIEQEQTFIQLLLPHQPKTPLLGTVRLELLVVWPWRGSDNGTKAKAALCDTYKVRPHGSRPDFDNWCKAFVDTLVALKFIEDDAKICDWILKKRFGANPGISVVISQVEDPWNKTN